jgi:LacI family transcriptional regulator
LFFSNINLFFINIRSTMPSRIPDRRGRAAHEPQVALIVDTVIVSGRGVLAGIAQYIREHGPWLTYHEPRDAEHAVPAWIRGWKGDGILVRSQNRKILSAVLATGLPAVDVLGEARPLKLPLVHVDNRRIAQLAADHLMDIGLASFGFCHQAGACWSEERRNEFIRCLAAEQHPCSVYDMKSGRGGRYSWAAEQSAMAAWLAGLSKPAGVLVCSDWHGHTVLGACRRAGLAIPDDIAILSVDNDEVLCSVCEPPLSSVIGDYEKVGYVAAGMLANMMEGRRRGPPVVLIPPRGIAVRRSTDILTIREGLVCQALRLIRASACKGLAAEEVIRQIPASGTLIRRTFRRVLGRSIHDEIIKTRLNEALFLLRESDLSLAEIAERTGFKSQTRMGTVMKMKLQETPRQYRRQWRMGRG